MGKNSSPGVRYRGKIATMCEDKFIVSKSDGTGVWRNREY
jgi:hypothetical protein